MCSPKAVLAGPALSQSALSRASRAVVRPRASTSPSHFAPERIQVRHCDGPPGPRCPGSRPVSNSLPLKPRRLQQAPASSGVARSSLGNGEAAESPSNSKSGFGAPEFAAMGVAVAVLLADFHQGRLVSGGGALLLPLATSMVSTAAAGSVCVPALRKLRARQVVRSDGPQSHISKAGTPTAGGAFVIPCGVLVGLCFSAAHPAVLVAALGTLGMAGIGLRDDMLKICERSSRGISGRWKLQMQVLVSALVGAAVHFLLAPSGVVPQCVGSSLQLMAVAVPLGVLPYWGLSVFTIVAESNAVNLTDGLDGLAACTSSVALAAMAICLADVSRPLATFSAAMAGAAAGFLPHNRHVARCFMGDTGSLALGGALGIIGSLSGAFVPLAIATAVFVAEASSVILQVGWFKYTKAKTGAGQRLLRMAPLHHHFELLGWHETRVTSTLTLCAGLSAAAAVAVAKFAV